VSVERLTLETTVRTLGGQDSRFRAIGQRQGPSQPAGRTGRIGVVDEANREPSKRVRRYRAFRI
jgi:hypothetical protein